MHYNIIRAQFRPNEAESFSGERGVVTKVGARRETQPHNGELQLARVIT